MVVTSAPLLAWPVRTCGSTSWTAAAGQQGNGSLQIQSIHDRIHFFISECPANYRKRTTISEPPHTPSDAKNNRYDPVRTRYTFHASSCRRASVTAVPSSKVAAAKLQQPSVSSARKVPQTPHQSLAILPWCHPVHDPGTSRLLDCEPMVRES